MSGPRNAGLEKVAQFGTNFKARFYQVASLHVGQSSTRQLKAGLECGWPEEAHQDNNREIRLYKVTLDPKLPKYIQILDIFGFSKIQPDVVQSPGSQISNTVGDAGAVDRVESVEALVLTAYTTLYVIGVLVASTILAGIGKKRKYQQRRPKEDPRGALPPLLLRLQAHDEVWHHVQAYV